MNGNDSSTSLDGEVKASAAGTLKILSLVVMRASLSSKRLMETAERHRKPKMIESRRK